MRNTWLLVLSFLLASCSPGNSFSPTLPSTSANTLTPILAHTPTPILTPTSVPTLTPTQTPTPTPIGGGLIRFNGIVGTDSYCGIMTTGGQIQAKHISGYTSDVPPMDCPERGDWLGPHSSNDNKYFYFWTCCGTFADSILFVGNIFDHNLIQIQTGNYLQRLYPKWLDDQHLLVLFDHTTHDLIVYNTQTGQGKNIGNYPSALPIGIVQYNVPSPDGKYTLIQSNKSGSINLFLVSTDGTSEKNVTDGLGLSNIYDVEWAPDGSRFAFYSQIDNKVYTFIMDRNGSVLRKIENAENPKWSSKGNVLFLWSRQGGGLKLNIWNEESESSTIIMDIGGATDFSYSPDGSRFIYRECILRSNLKYECTVKIYLTEKSESKTLSVSKDDLSFGEYDMVKWSPDGQWFILNLASGKSMQFHKTVLLCDPLIVCNEIRIEGLNIQGADWR